MSNSKLKSHPSNPANQPFSVSPRHNRSKRKAWWQLGDNNNKRRGD